MNTTKHWQTVYKTKTPEQVSWTEGKPEVSLQLIADTNVPKSAKIIDIGGGDSKLVDYLLEEGYINITVLDISSMAIERAQKRLGDNAKRVTWIVEDITHFQPDTIYDLWHDRAAFHFLTKNEDIENYSQLTQTFVSKYMIIGTFSKQGPTKCSGLEVSQYDDIALTKVYQSHFEKIECFTTDHQTPFGTSQNFLFCSFKKRA